MTGDFWGTAVFGASEPNETTLVSAGGFDLFVAKYDSDGHLVGVKQAGGTGWAGGQGLSVDGSGNIYVTGTFSDTAVFGASEPNETTLVSAGNADIFVAKYAIGDTDGDGIPDADDQCPNSDTRPTVIVETCDSGVTNWLLSEPLGCTITDEILKIVDGATSHGQFVARVDKFLLGLQNAGILEPNEKNAIKDCAAQSTLP